MYKAPIALFCGLPLVAFVAPTLMNAGPIPPATLFTELIIDMQADNADAIETLFGPDSASPLHFTSSFNPVAMTFAYSLIPGSTYEAMPMTFAGSGTFDPGTTTFTAISSGALGTVSWNTAGAGSLAATSSGFTTAFDGNLFSALLTGTGLLAGEEDFHSETDFNLDTGVSTTTTWKTTGGKEQPGTRKTRKDHRTATGSWDLDDDSPKQGYKIDSSGFSPLDGSLGSFTTTITAVPEPVPYFLVGAAILLLTVRRIGLRPVD